MSKQRLIERSTFGLFVIVAGYFAFVVQVRAQDQFPADIRTLEAKTIEAIRAAGIYGFEDVVCFGSEAATCQTILEGQVAYMSSGQRQSRLVVKSSKDRTDCMEVFVTSEWSYGRRCDTNTWMKQRSAAHLADHRYSNVSDLMAYAFNKCSPNPSGMVLEQASLNGRPQAVVRLTYPAKRTGNSLMTYEDTRKAVLYYDATTHLPQQADLFIESRLSMKGQAIPTTTLMRRTYQFGAVTMPSLPPEAFGAPESSNASLSVEP